MRKLALFYLIKIYLLTSEKSLPNFSCALLINSLIIEFSVIKDKNDFFISSMKTASKELQKLRSMAEKSLAKTAELQQVLAQIEATLSRAEAQKVIQKISNN